ncbi:MAG: hypothetical protein J5722_03340, partial [Oscillospiraceae bacterium]|nr:hypothetical protein [Oscillospiraceae bacterium]
MICKRCGSQIFNNAKTCPFCAAVVGAENETDPNQNVIPSLEEIETPGNQMQDLTAPVQPPAAPVSRPAQPDPSGVPATPPAQQNPFGNPAVQPPAQQNPFGNPAVQPPAAAENQQIPQNPFGAPQQSAASSQSPAPGQQSSFAPLPPINDVGASGSSLAGIPIRLITKIVLVMALLAFALPFVTISCSMGAYGGDQVIATYSGFDLMKGNLEYEDPTQTMNDSLSGIFGEEFVNNENEDEISDFDAIFNSDDDDPLISYRDEAEDEDAAAEDEEIEEDTQRKNYYLIAAWIVGVIGLVLFFFKGKKLELVTMLCSMLSAMLTLFSSFMFGSFYHITSDEQMAELI